MLKTPRVSEHQTLLEVMQSLSLLVVLVLVGCDKVETLVSDAKQEIAQQTGTVEQPAAQPSMPSTAAPIVTPPVAAPEAPSPEKVLAEFRSILPSQVEDSALARLVAVPEAAAQVTSLDLSGNQRISGAGLQMLEKLPNLKSLTMQGASRISAADLSVLSQTTKLTDLDLSGGQLTDQHLAAVAEAKSLTRVVVSGTPVTAAGISHLAALPSLSELDANHTLTDDSSVVALKNAPLVSVNLNFSQVTDQALSVLGNIETLERLWIGETQVTGFGFQKPPFTNLKYLALAKNRFGVEGLIAIKKLKNLEELTLFSCNITFDNGKQVDPRTNVFKSFSKLKALSISGNGISDVGLVALIAGHKNLQVLHLDSLKGIGDPGIVRLVTCPKLTEVYVPDTSVSAAGAKELKSKLPNVTIIGSFGKL